MIHLSLPASLTNSSIPLMTFFISLCPAITASNIISSDNISASDSTIRMASLVPATIRSSFEFSMLLTEGLITHLLSI